MMKNLAASTKRYCWSCKGLDVDDARSVEFDLKRFSRFGAACGRLDREYPGLLSAIEHIRKRYWLVTAIRRHLWRTLEIVQMIVTELPKDPSNVELPFSVMALAQVRNTAQIGIRLAEAFKYRNLDTERVRTISCVPGRSIPWQSYMDRVVACSFMDANKKPRRITGIIVRVQESKNQRTSYVHFLTDNGHIGGKHHRVHVNQITQICSSKLPKEERDRERKMKLERILRRYVNMA